MASNTDLRTGYDAEVEFNRGESPTDTKLNNWAEMIEAAIVLISKAVGDITYYHKVGSYPLMSSLTKAIGQADLVSPPFSLKENAEYTSFVLLTSA